MPGSRPRRLLTVVGCLGLALLPLCEVAAQTSGITVESVTADRATTLVFRIGNRDAVARTIETQLHLPAGWAALFDPRTVEIPAGAVVTEFIAVSPPRTAAAGHYTIRFEARSGPGQAPVTATASLVVDPRRALTHLWDSPRSVVLSGEPAEFTLQITNDGNIPEAIALDLRNAAGVPLQSTWRDDTIAPGETRRIAVLRPQQVVRVETRDTLTATLTTTDAPPAAATLGLLIVPEGRAPAAVGLHVPSSVILRAGTGRQPGFGSFLGGGPLNSRRTASIQFGFIARDRSHPLLFEQNRNHLTLAAPGVSIRAGDQSWSLSYLTENGHYGSGAGVQIRFPVVSIGAFADTGRRDVREASQAGGFIGLQMGRHLRLSGQYLARFADALDSPRVADLGSVKITLKPVAALTADVEVGRGRSQAGTGHAMAAGIALETRFLTVQGRGVRRDDAYPMRDRTGLINGGYLAVRPFGRLRIDATFNGTDQIDDPTLPLSAPTRQRIARNGVAWGSLVNVSVSRLDWTRPGQSWSSGWRREAVTAELRIPLGPVWLAPGAERGRESTPEASGTPFTLGWLGAGVSVGRSNHLSMRVEYGRGDRGNPDRIARRVSFRADLRPIPATRLIARLHNSARDAVWMSGSQSVSGTLDQRLPWGHRLVLTYERRSGRSAFLRQDSAHRVEYVVPIGLPVPAAAATGTIVVRVRDEASGQALTRMLVRVAGQGRVTDRQGVVSFTGLRPGEYSVSIAPDSLGPDQIVLPTPIVRVEVLAGRESGVVFSVARTAAIAGDLRVYQRRAGLAGTPENSALVPGAGLARARIELHGVDRVRVTLTDEQGRFRFDDLPPGRWQVRVTQVTVPPFFTLEQAEVTVDVAAGGLGRVTLRAVPKELVDGGG